MPNEDSQAVTTGLAATIFDNAITSIKLGLKDFSDNTEARLLSAVRNLHAGILLLYKARLSELSAPGSDDALVKKNIVPKRLPSGEIVFKGVGKRPSM